MGPRGPISCGKVAKIFHAYKVNVQLLRETQLSVLPTKTEGPQNLAHVYLQLPLIAGKH